MDLRCVQINLQKARVASVELRVPDLGDVALIQEPYVLKGTPRYLDTAVGNIYAFKGKARTAIYVRKELDVWLVEEFTSEDLCVCTIKVEGQLWYFASLYLDITESIVSVCDSRLNKLLEWCENHKIPLLIAADCNAHSVLWGCENSNSRGEELEEVILTRDLTVLNEGNECTFQTIRAKSIIDITLVNSTAAELDLVTDWKVETDIPSHSDHKYVFFSLGRWEATVRKGRSWKNFNQEAFKQKVRAALQPGDATLRVGGAAPRVGVASIGSGGSAALRPGDATLRVGGAGPCVGGGSGGGAWTGPRSGGDDNDNDDNGGPDVNPAEGDGPHSKNALQVGPATLHFERGASLVGPDKPIAYSVLRDVIETAVDEVAPLKEVKLGRRRTPWWTAELGILRDELRNLSSRRWHSEEDHEAYVMARSEYKRAVKDAKKSSWREFCTKTDSAKSVSDLVKLLEADKVYKVSLHKVGHRVSATPEEALGMLLEAAFPDHVGLAEDGSQAGGAALRPGGDALQVGEVPSERCERSEGLESFLLYLTTNKVWAAIKSFGPKKAPGPDEWPPLVLQSLPEEAVEYLTEVYKKSCEQCEIPREWREMRVVFIPKVGKECYTSPKSYRPITLSNFVLKVLERIIQWYLTDRVVCLPLYGQHAYTAGRSTESALSEVVNIMEKMVYNGKSVLAVSLDCSGAFDNINFESARIALREKGVCEELVAWYDKVLRTRIITAELQGEKRCLQPTKGSPQGGVLSPLVWILIMDSLLS